MVAEKITSANLIERLRGMGGDGDGAMAVITEVPEMLGGSHRRCDALGMGLWKSRGLELCGYEIKVSRSDWLRELKTPAKADGIFSYCDRWYLVVSEASIVKSGELPPTWGLMVPHGNSLRIAVQAEKNASPHPVDRPFLASIFQRCLQCSATADELNAARAAGYNQGLEAGRNERSTRRHGADVVEMAESYRKANDALREQIKKFEDASGLSVSAYGGGKELGEVVGLVRKIPSSYIASNLVRQAKEMRELLVTVEEKAAAMINVELLLNPVEVQP